MKIIVPSSAVIWQAKTSFAELHAGDIFVRVFARLVGDIDLFSSANRSSMPAGAVSGVFIDPEPLGKVSDTEAVKLASKDTVILEPDTWVIIVRLEP